MSITESEYAATDFGQMNKLNSEGLLVTHFDARNPWKYGSRDRYVSIADMSIRDGVVYLKNDLQLSSVSAIDLFKELDYVTMDSKFNEIDLNYMLDRLESWEKGYFDNVYKIPESEQLQALDNIESAYTEIISEMSKLLEIAKVTEFISEQSLQRFDRFENEFDFTFVRADLIRIHEKAKTGFTAPRNPVGPNIAGKQPLDGLSFSDF